MLKLGKSLKTLVLKIEIFSHFYVLFMMYLLKQDRISYHFLFFCIIIHLFLEKRNISLAGNTFPACTQASHETFNVLSLLLVQMSAVPLSQGLNWISCIFSYSQDSILLYVKVRG